MENAIELGIFERAAIRRERSLSDARQGKGGAGDPAASSRSPNRLSQERRPIRIRGTLTISI